MTNNFGEIKWYDDYKDDLGFCNYKVIVPVVLLYVLNIFIMLRGKEGWELVESVNNNYLNCNT